MASPEPAQPPKKVLTERQSFWRAAVIMTSAIVIMMVIFVIFYPEPKGITEQQQVQQAEIQSPQIIPNPADGRAPTNPGDPGGWEQIALFFVMVTGMLTVGGLAWRGGQKAKRAQASALTKSTTTAASAGPQSS